MTFASGVTCTENTGSTQPNTALVDPEATMRNRLGSTNRTSSGILPAPDSSTYQMESGGHLDQDVSLSDPMSCAPHSEASSTIQSHLQSTNIQSVNDSNDIEMGDICTDTHSGVGARQEAGGVVDSHRLDEGLTDDVMVVDQALDNERPIQLGEEGLIDAEGSSDDMNMDDNGVRAETSMVSDGHSELDGDSLPKHTTFGNKRRSKDMESSDSRSKVRGSESTVPGNNNKYMQNSDGESSGEESERSVRGKNIDNMQSSDSENEGDESEWTVPGNDKKSDNGRGARGRGRRGGRGRGRGRGGRGGGGKTLAPPRDLRTPNILDNRRTIKMADHNIPNPIPLRFMTPIDLDMLVFTHNNYVLDKVLNYCTRMRNLR